MVLGEQIQEEVEEMRELTGEGMVMEVFIAMSLS